MDKAKQISAAVYCRYSSEQQRTSLSIEAQRRSCEDYAKKQGWKIYKFYVDEARSGTDAERRPEFQKMILDAMATDPAFQVVLVHKSDRFARNREDAVKYKALLKRQQIRFHSATEPIGSGDVTEVLLESMLDGIAEFYSLQLSQRTLAGMVEAARHGWAVGRPPFGYKHEKVETEKGPKNKLVIDPAPAGIVRRVFALYLKGNGAHAIRQKLGKDGRGLSKNFILWMLRNDKYAGHSSYGYAKNGRQPAKTSIEPVTVKNTHEAIIDKKTWARAQAILAKKAAGVEMRAVTSDYLLSGILKCTCGAPMNGHSANGNGGRFRYYSCSVTMRKGKGSCELKPMPADRLEKTVLLKIKEYLTNEKNLLSLIDANNEFLFKMQKNKSKDLARLRAEISRKDEAAKNLMRAVEADKGLNLGHVAGRLDEISLEKAQLEARAQELEAFQAAKPVTSGESARFIGHLASIFKSGIIHNKTLLQGLVLSIQLMDAGRKATVSYNPRLHPQNDVLGLPIAKNHPCASMVRMGDIWLPRQDLGRTPLLIEHIIRLDFMELPGWIPRALRASLLDRGLRARLLAR